MKRQTIELFSGTKSFSKIAKVRGNSTFTIDNVQDLNPDLVADIKNLDVKTLPVNPFIIWASPPCTAFSVAAFGHHWGGGKKAYEPKTADAKLGIDLLRKTIQLIGELKPTYWFIENPRGMMRKMPILKDVHKQTISYCQYGDTRMKPTDIWTNLTSWEGRLCSNGAPCHEPAPRGSRTGTQGLANAKLRGVIPPQLFRELFDEIERQELLKTIEKKNV